MAKLGKKDLQKFLEVFPKDKRVVALWLRDFVWKLYPFTNELIYDNYNALAFGWSPTESLGHTFCSIAVMRANYNIHFGFLRGAELSDPDRILQGKGNQYRYVLVGSTKDFPRNYLKKLMSESYLNAMARVKDSKQIVGGNTFIKSASGARRKATATKKTRGTSVTKKKK
jgi:hypothetical protein